MWYLPLAAILALLAPSIASAAQRPAGSPVEALLTSAAAALGADALPSIRTIHATARGKEAGVPATFESWTDTKKNVNAEYVDADVLSGAAGYDGHSAWNRDVKGVVWVDGSFEGRGAAVNEAFRQSYALFRAGHGGARITLEEPREGTRGFQVLSVTPPGGLPFAMWFDDGTHRPVRIVETVEASTTTTLLSDYRRVSGFQVPFKATFTSVGGGGDGALTIDRVTTDDPSDDAHLVKPESTANDYDISGASQTTVPFELKDDHIYLDVALNGKGPFHFELDTGGQNVVDAAVAREVGALSSGSMQGGGVGDSTEDFQFAHVQTLAIGNAVLRDQVFSVGAVRAGFGVASSAPVDGLIGFEVLARYVTSIDYQRERLTLSLPGSARGTRVPGTTIPFVFLGNHPQIACIIDGIPGDCQIDTGSRTSIDLLTPFVAAHPSVVPADATAPAVSGFGVGGASRTRLGRLQSLELGGFTLRDLVAGFSIQTEGFFAGKYLAANVGGGVWKRFTVTFDYPHQTVTLEPNDAFARRDSYDRSGLFVIDAKGRFVAMDVLPHSPAGEAGIANGDTIVTLDGSPASQLTLGTIRAAFRRPSGSAVKLEVASPHSPGTRIVTFALRDYL